MSLADSLHASLYQGLHGGILCDGFPVHLRILQAFVWVSVSCNFY